MSKIKISIIGSCVTRDPFNSKFVSDYKKYYECVDTYWQASFVSAMSQKIEVNVDELQGDNINPQQLKTMMVDANKDFFSGLVDKKPDYIIYDFYSDLRYGAVKIGNNYTTNNPNSFRKTKFYKESKFDSIHSFTKNYNEYFELWKKSFDMFYKYVKENFKDTKLILHCMRFTDAYRDVDGEIKMFDLKKFHYIYKENELLNNLYQYIKEHYDTYYIDLRDCEYLGDATYPFGLTPWHFEKKYYKDFINELNSIALIDLINK